MKRISLMLACMLAFTFSSFSQDKQEINPADYSNTSVEMADTFRADGKIYVVVAVILVLLAGVFAYLIILDRKVSRLEKQSDKASE